MIARLNVAALALIVLLPSCRTTVPLDEGYLRQFTLAEDAALPFAPVTEMRPSTTFAEAYRLQAALAGRRVRAGDNVVGYKGGLMSQASLRARGVTEPVIGVLFRSGRMADGAVVSLCGYRRASLEAKLGFVFSSSSKPGRKSTRERRAVSEVVPVIDLPDIGYRDPDRYGAVDMVAANVSAARWVVGSAHAPDTTDLDALTVTVLREGEQVASGRGNESLGGQWGSLDTVTSQVHASGRRVKKGEIVITGKMGARIWLTPGRYRVDYGPLGEVAFSVVTCGR